MFPIPSTFKSTFEKPMIITNKNLVKINPNFNVDILKINENDIIGNSLQDFIILSQLSRGSNGTIYKVRSRLNNKEYVLKKVNLKNLNIAQQKEVFKEAKILKKVKHPHIIRYYQSFRDDGSLYIIMEYAEGGDLQKLIRVYQEKKKYFTEQEIWRFAGELSGAILYLHSHRIIHRDIKTLNVFLSYDYRIKLGDLGFSKIVSNLESLQNNRVGTPMYLSPEMIKLKPYDFKVDVWGLGCVLYHVSTLEPPFMGENLMILGYNIINKVPKSVPLIYSDKLNKFIMWLLIKIPLNRPRISEVFESLNIPNKQNNENFPNFNRDKESSINLFKNFKSKHQKDEKILQPEKHAIASKIETNDFKKYYELNKQLLENKNKDINKQSDIKKLFEPSTLFFDAYDPNPQKLRTQTSQAQFRYKEKPNPQSNETLQLEKIETTEKNEKTLFETNLSSIYKNNEISHISILNKQEKAFLSNERILFMEEEEKNKIGDEKNKNEDENNKKEEENKNMQDFFIRTNKIDNFNGNQQKNTVIPTQTTAPKIIRELQKTKSISNLLENSEVNLFQKFRKNKLSKREYPVKSNKNIQEKTTNDFNMMMQFTLTKKIGQDSFKFNEEKRAMTAFEGKRETHFLNSGSSQVDKGTELLRGFFPQATLQHFPKFAEQRPNTTGSDKFRKKFTIKDLE